VGRSIARTRLAFRNSVFAKLVVIMITMAASLLLLVAGFFWFIATPTITTTIDRVLDNQARQLATTRLDLETARGLGSRLGFDVRYDGPAGHWSTTDNLPTVEDVRQGGVARWSRLIHGRRYFVVDAPGGGSYLFAWNVPRAMQGAHLALLLLLLVVMAAVVLIAHIVLERLLRPLRDLSEAVGRLGTGDFAVTLPNPTRDEFGRLTDAFNRMVDRVRAMISARDQLLVDVSHELRSPLTRINVALEFLPMDEQRAGIAGDVAEMERMITTLLELERLRGGCRVRMVRQDLMPIVREVTATFQDKPPGVSVLALAPGLLVDIDAEQVRMVLRNLVENATKYSLPDSRAVEISADQNGEHVVIRVTDDGPGIPECDLSRLFEPFFRVDRSRSKSTGGYGLGLAISKRIVEAHGGTITVRNDPCRGASFIVMLPKAA
jgi:signal transduction histidine kinase